MTRAQPLPLVSAVSLTAPLWPLALASLLDGPCFRLPFQHGK